MFGFGIAAKLSMVMGVATLVMAGIFYWYYVSSQETISELSKSIATFESNEVQYKERIEEHNETIKKLDEERAEDQRIILRITQQRNDSQRKVNELQQTFSRHNMENISMNKPGLIENIINKGTADVGRRLVDITSTDELEETDNEN